MSTGGDDRQRGLNQFSNIGVEAMTGIRDSVRQHPTRHAIHCLHRVRGHDRRRTTAQLGAMRINEEIDALEVMGIRPIAYLAATRVQPG